jgi:hypothetical protein
MKTQSPNTHPDIEKIQIEGYRRMSAAKKLRCVRDMNQFGQKLALADVRRRHPDADERECRLRVASRWLSADLMRKAFGWDPEKQGY